MPSATDGVPYLNKAPLFFCSPGDKNNCTEIVKDSFTGSSETSAEAYRKWRDVHQYYEEHSRSKYDYSGNDHYSLAVDHEVRTNGDCPTAFAWPPGTQLRVKILSGQNVFPAIEQIIKTTVNGWSAGLTETLTFQWVSSCEQADIRISFYNDKPNWSALGARAALYDEKNATMNLALGGWRGKQTVFTHGNIARAAAHLFGHALGLPHAVTTWSSPWNETVLDSNYGPFWADLIQSNQGSPDLQNPLSIMAFDRPASLGSGTDERHGGSVIDAESLSLLRKRYPKLPNVHGRELICSHTSGWRAGTGDIKVTQRCQTSETSNIITGITRLDIGLGGNIRLRSYTANVVDDGFEVVLGSWADTLLHDASCNIMSFGEQDSRILTGTEDYRGWKSEYPNDPGKARSRRINFSRLWRKVPGVVAFISGLDFEKWTNLRCNVNISDIDQFGFTLNLSTWADTIVNDIQVGWLAHEVDDYSIRSGRLDAPDHSTSVKVSTISTNFSSPMRRRPQAMFRALTYIDTKAAHHRFQLEVTWTDTNVEGTFKTWETESQFYCLKGCYVAVL